MDPGQRPSLPRAQWPASYVYLDSRMQGAALQLARYFDSGVFCRRSATVIYRPYKESARHLEKLFARLRISCSPLPSLARLPDLDGCVVYYPFNAQSNCRMVAQRGARHVFVTHGESNKAASCKPIIRLYDYVVTAGLAGVDRLVHARVFKREEAEGGRVLRLGTTFVASSGYRRSDGTLPAHVLYAPTWEGGIESENYSSAGCGDGLRYVAAHARATGVDRLAIQPHPNLGHRLPAYRKGLYRQILQLATQGYRILLVDGRCSASERWRLRVMSRGRIEIVDAAPPIHVSQAFTDLSAMETQLLSDGIDYGLLLRRIPDFALANPMLAAYYSTVAILDWRESRVRDPLAAELRERVKDYCISYSDPSLAAASPAERMQWLHDHVSTNVYWEG